MDPAGTSWDDGALLNAPPEGASRDEFDLAMAFAESQILDPSITWRARIRRSSARNRKKSGSQWIFRFPFTRYGPLDGNAMEVSDDAIEDEKQGLLFTAPIAVPNAKLQVDGKVPSL